MNSNPLVSGIIIFLNGEEFLEEAIESVFAQTYENWELLLVDDGSTDSSTAIAQRYATQYPEKVRYLEHEGHQNRGMSATRNLGISSAKGEYVAFLDADDIWLPQKLERQVATLESNPEAAVVFGPTQYWYSWTGNPEDSDKDSLREIGVQPNQLFKPPMLLSLLLHNQVNAPATCSVLIRREVFEKTGGFEESFRGLFEDRAFFAKVYLKVPVFVTSEYWDRYRQHPDSTCSVAARSTSYNPYGKSSAHLTFLNWIGEYLTQQGVENTQVQQALQKGLFPYHHPVWFFLLRTKYQCQIKLIELLKSLGQWNLLTRIRLWLEDNIRLMILRYRVKHISGTQRINYEMDELIVLCVVRNGEVYIKSFIDHYFSLGVKHIVFLDNGSTDETIAIAQSYKNVTILQGECNYQKYENVMKKYLVKRFSQNRWNLFADIDELFDYPFSDVISLHSLITYLNKNSYTAVVTQMLDLFSNQNFTDLKSKENSSSSLKEIYNYYDISNLEKTNYNYGTPSNPDVKMHWGGIRKTLFGTKNGLTKAALTFIDKKIKVFRSYHHVENAYLADFTCVFFHYYFVSTFYEKVLDAVQANRYNCMHEYQMYWQKLKQSCDFKIETETSEKLEDVNGLVENGFLVISEDYMQWVVAHNSKSNFPKTTTIKLVGNPQQGHP
jgi:glycosyltransferase involved in cell wall biosynthesis